MYDGFSPTIVLGGIPQGKENEIQDGEVYKPELRQLSNHENRVVTVITPAGTLCPAISLPTDTSLRCPKLTAGLMRKPKSATSQESIPS